MNVDRLRLKIRDLCDELEGGDDGGGGGRGTHVEDRFPPAGVDIVYHDLRVRLDVGETGEGNETVNLHGKMLIQRGDPFTNKEGRRQIDFRVLSWEASGWSWILNQAITYVLSDGVEQPVSSITAEQEDSDYPARFDFNVVFDARANNMTVFTRHHGRPEGHGFMTVPPNGNRKQSPTITTFEDVRVAVDHPTLGRIVAIPIDCNDQKSETLATL